VATRIVETSDSDQTEALGAELARKLKPGDIVLLCGELGTGKTTLVRGAARALGVSDPVTSPTFALGNRYRGEGVVVSHLDLYRLGGLTEEEPDLLEDYLGSERIAFVEWPERESAELCNARVIVTLLHLGADRRRIEVQECEQDTTGSRGLSSPLESDPRCSERLSNPRESDPRCPEQLSDPRESDLRRSERRGSASAAP
jgi:tRNA threonylcarbamoyladenosine biosynthesis protein TsaE